MSTELDKVLSKVRKLIEEQILSLVCDKLINKNNVLKHINLDNKFLVLPANEYEIFNKYISNGHNKEQFDKWVIFKWEEKNISCNDSTGIH